jgi:integrase
MVDLGDGRWRLRLCVGRDATGKQLYLHETVHGKKSDADKALTRMLVAVDIGQPITRNRQTLDGWTREWLSIHCTRAGVRTRWDYEQIFRRYLTPELRGRRLTALTASDLQRWVNKLSARGLSPRTVRSAHGAVRASLNKARRLGLVPVNVAELVDLPRQQHSEMRTLTAREAERLLNGAEAAGSPYYPLFALMLHTGLRPGELAGLRWEDYDGTTLRVRRALKQGRAGEPRYLGATKTHRPKVIPLGERARRALATQRRWQAERRLLLGSSYRDPELVFANEVGGPLEFSNVRERHFKPLLKRLELPDIRLYDLRHTCATLLLAAGENIKVVSERLGHVNATVTLNTYVHVLPGMQAEASAKLDKLLTGAVLTNV